MLVIGESKDKELRLANLAILTRKAARSISPWAMARLKTC